MSFSTARSSVRWSVCGTVLFLVGVLTLGKGQPATSSPPPHEEDPSGLLLQSPSPEQLKVLTLGLRSDREIEASYAVQSTRRDRAWYVGARLDGPDGIDTIGVWLLTGPRSQPSLLFSVDPEAQTASTWPNAQKSGIPTSAVDAEALALTSALRSK